jgi:hypothetical protein
MLSKNTTHGKNCVFNFRSFLKVRHPAELSEFSLSPALFLLVPDDSFYMSRNMCHERQNTLKTLVTIWGHISIHIIIPVLRP